MHYSTCKSYFFFKEPKQISGLRTGPARGGNLFNRKLGSIAHGLLLSLSYRPNLTETVEKDVIDQSVSYCIIRELR